MAPWASRNSACTSKHYELIKVYLPLKKNKGLEICQIAMQWASKWSSSFPSILLRLYSISKTINDCCNCDLVEEVHNTVVLCPSQNITISSL